MESICTTALPSIGVGILLFFSEMLPFISTVKANGITEFVVKVMLKYLHKKKNQIDLEAGNGGVGNGGVGNGGVGNGEVGNEEIENTDNCCEEDSILLNK